MNLLNLLEPNMFSDMIMRNTDLGDLHATHLNATIMSVADMILELDPLVGSGELQWRSAARRHRSGQPFAVGSDP